MRHHLAQYLEDISQSFFLRNAWFGALLLALLARYETTYFAYGAAGSLLAYAATARFVTPRLLRDGGLLTINGFFLGIAMASLFEPSPIAGVLVIAGALIVPVMTLAAFEVLQHWKLSVYVAPYIFCAWVLLLCGGAMGIGMRTDVWPSVIATLPPRHEGWSLAATWLDSAAQSTSRLLFLPSSELGVCLLAAVTVFSPRRGIYLSAGSLLGAAIAALITPGHAWEHGLYSFSAGLVGLGLASRPEKLAAHTILPYCALSCLATIALDRLLRPMGIPMLSLPYVLCMWLAILSRAPRLNLRWDATLSAPRPEPRAATRALTPQTPETVAETAKEAA